MTKKNSDDDIKKTIKKSLNENPNQRYGADNITVLEGIEAVRKRPAMYMAILIQNTAYEVADNQ